MITSWLAVNFLLWELLLSSLVHLLYGFYIFSSAVAGDVAEALNLAFRFRFRKFNLVKFEHKTVESIKSSSSRNLEQLPPIVLVHGIFGFGKGVCTLWRSLSISAPFLNVSMFFFFL